MNLVIYHHDSTHPIINFCVKVPYIFPEQKVRYIESTHNILIVVEELTYFQSILSRSKSAYTSTCQLANHNQLKSRHETGE